jgi:serine/threonine protein kinase
MKLYESSHSIVEVIESVEGEPTVRKTLKNPQPTPNQIFRFENEYPITRDLNVKGVRKALAKKQVGNRYTLELEYVEGESLDAYLAVNTFQLEDFLAFAIDITQILDAIHSKGVIHKDINPRNILLAPDNTPNLIDFGIAARFMLKAKPHP